MTLICDAAGERIDAAIARLCPELSRSAAQRLLEDGCVTCDGVPLRKNARTVVGQRIELTLPEPEPLEALPEDIPLDVRYEDEDVIVINKPKGLVVHPAPGHASGTLVNALLYHCGASLSGVGGALRPGIVHRIDKDTSGLLIVAKNDFAHQALSAQLSDHSMHRTYEAVACGGFRDDTGTIDAPIGRHPQDRKRMAVVPDGRPAVTHYEVLTRYPGYTHLRLRLETGRTHQIRVHLAWKNHPILGDMVYGHKKPELGQATQCLHACALTFAHPRTGEQMTVTCERPAYFTGVLEALARR